MKPTCRVRQRASSVSDMDEIVCPPITTSPSLVRSSPAMRFSRGVLPEPLRPISPSNAPSATSRFTCLRTRARRLHRAPLRALCPCPLAHACVGRALQQPVWGASLHPAASREHGSLMAAPKSGGDILGDNKRGLAAVALAGQHPAL